MWGKAFLVVALLAVSLGSFSIMKSTPEQEQVVTNTSTTTYVTIREVYPIALRSEANLTPASPALVLTQPQPSTASALERQLAELLPNIKWLMDAHTTTLANRESYYTPEHIARLERQIIMMDRNFM